MTNELLLADLDRCKAANARLTAERDAARAELDAVIESHNSTPYPVAYARPVKR